VAIGDPCLELSAVIDYGSTVYDGICRIALPMISRDLERWKSWPQYLWG